MNLLVLTPIVPFPPHDGDKLRLYHFLKSLGSQGHRIDLFCLTRDASGLRDAAGLRTLCRRLYVEVLSDTDLFLNLVGGALVGRSFNVASHFSPKLREVLKAYWGTREGKAVDAVLAHRLRMAPAAFEGNPGKPVVLDLTDCLAEASRQLSACPGIPPARRFAAWWDQWFLRKEEAEWGALAAKALVISERDAERLREGGLGPDRIAVLPNGVGTGGGGVVSNPYPAGRPVVCFVGNMGYAPNEDGALWFLKEVWPSVKREVPEALFAAVGGRPRGALRRLHDGREVLVTGWVPGVEPYLRHAALSVAPLRVAVGMQNKVALALALGVPVVATPRALEWMPPALRSTVREESGPEGFAAGVVETLRSPRGSREKARRGGAMVRKLHRWEVSGRMLGSILKQASAGGGSHEGHGHEGDPRGGGVPIGGRPGPGRGTGPGGADRPGLGNGGGGRPSRPGVARVRGPGGIRET